MGPTTIATFLVLVLTPIIASSGGIYRWTDADGQVHFDDQPRDAAAEEVIVTTSATDQDTVQRLQRQQSMVQELQKKRAEKREHLAKAREEKDKMAAKCVNAQTRLMRLQRARYVYEPGGNGERRALSDLERKKSTDKAKLEARRWCV